jgi:hypothetical protein
MPFNLGGVLEVLEKGFDAQIRAESEAVSMIDLF